MSRPTQIKREKVVKKTFIWGGGKKGIPKPWGKGAPDFLQYNPSRPSNNDTDW